MSRRATPILGIVAVLSSLSACKGEEKQAPAVDAARPAVDAAPPAPAPAPALPEPDPLPPEVDLSGPTAPETSTVFFSVEGAMIPMACYHQGKKKLLAGKSCLPLVPSDGEVFLASESGRALDTITGKKNALCELADTPTSLTTASLDSGSSYAYAAYPKGLGRSVLVIPAAAESNRATELSEVTRSRLADAAAAAEKKAAAGVLRATQRAEVDLDDDGEKEQFVSVVVVSAENADRTVFSGLFQLPRDPKAAPTLLERAKGEDIVRLRGAVDLDGDGSRELWLGLTFDGGSADRIYDVAKDGALRPLGSWTCGA